MIFLSFLPIIPSFIQPIPLAPFTTIEKPSVAPTILCVPETGSLKNVATSSHRQEPKILYELKPIVLDYPPPPPKKKKKKKKVSIVKAIMIKCKFNSIIYFGHRKRCCYCGCSFILSGTHCFTFRIARYLV